MEILFLEIDTEAAWGLASVGPAYLASYLSRHGLQAGFVRVGHDQPVQQVIDSVRLKTPDMVGFSLTTRQWRRAARIASELRNTLKIPTIAGGHHPTFAPESVLQADGFDYLCLGEGEEALCELLTALERGESPVGRVPNIWIKGGPRPPLRRLTPDLDRLPHAAREMLDERHGVVHLLTQRGCPFGCTYCSASALKKLYGGHRIHRRRSVESVLEELLELRDRGPVNYVVFLDDTFTAGPEWVRAFCRAYGETIGVGFSINARVETVDLALLGTLAEAGCRHVVYGVESGSPRVRREVMGRRVDDQQLADAFHWTRKAGMMATANYMIGLPGETPEEIEQTLALNERLDPDDLACFVFFPYPGTQLFELCRQEGYLPDDWGERPVSDRRSILQLPDLGQDDIECFYERFEKVRERAQSRRLGCSSNGGRRVREGKDHRPEEG